MLSSSAAFNLKPPAFPPKDFVFGCATSAYQIEGSAWNEDGKGKSIWDTYAQTPGNIGHNDTGDVACDHYHRYKSDVQLFKNLGVNHYSFTISWTRILPNGRGPVNKKGLQFYKNLLGELHAAGITPICTLYHWDLPQALFDEYQGWVDRKVVDDFKHYATVVFEELGGMCSFWSTMNEPGTFCVRKRFGEGEGSRLKSKSTWDPSAPLKCLHNALLAHASAVKIYRDGNYPGRIGVITDGQVYYPLDPTSAADADAAQRAMTYYFGWVNHPIWNGDYPPRMRKELGSLLPTFTAEEIALVKGSSDYYAFDGYTSGFATLDPTCNPKNSSSVSTPTNYNNGILIGSPTQGGWNFQVPDGFRAALNYIHEQFSPPVMYITENGMAVLNEAVLPIDRVLDDANRVDWYRTYLQQLRAAIEVDKLPIKGFVYWSCMDNFEWADGYSSKFGVTHVNFATQQRTPKKSATFLKDVITKGHNLDHWYP
ncbi:beta-glucosidase 1A [Blyttiomyces helicus]|uniref:beta-glucosidase n=1 Tax=Blyttiomyces helicus TaxID=388810 RepID=A0A4P9WCJ0_9FUNG|nr:beta-glucosidase 1A [Blyttiomyces helicus]|eukprot:RKO89365.1 beta-glucosidase 1A [Blyttiomyces helicus]